MSFPKYPAYKDSGVEWLGEIPAHWEHAKLKFELAANDGGVWGDDPDDNTGTIVLRSTEQRVDGTWNIVDPAYRKLSINEKIVAKLRSGDLLITKSSGSALHIGKTSYVTDDVAALDCCFSNFMQRLRLLSKNDPKYFFYLLNNRIGRSQFDYLSSTTTGLANLNGSIIGDLRVSIPPLSEQRAIVAFLDAETARIDALVAKQEVLIATLQEKRHALISHAVTKGLDPAALMKDSGVMWLGEVPAHWTISRLKFVMSHIVDCLHATPLYVEDGEYPAIRTADIEPGKVDIDNAKKIDEEQFLKWTSRLLPIWGDILYSREGERYGIAALVPSGTILCISQRMMIFRVVDSFDSTFFMWQLNCPHVYEQATQDVLGSTSPHINIEHIRNFFLVVPPPDEQKVISEYIDELIVPLDSLVVVCKETIKFLREHRAALIAAAVTGQIDVRGYVAEDAPASVS